ncbi:MAG TPA: DUF3108 domain-containing protein [Dehalococcoidia bacterium]
MRRHLRRLLLPLIIAGSLLVAAGCDSDGAGPTRASIVEDIPWTAPQAYRYVLKDEDQKEQGRGTIAVRSDGDNFVFRQQFSDADGNSDEALLAVHADTLLPIAGRRTIIDSGDDRRSVVDTQYEQLSDGSNGVCIRQTVFKPPTKEEPDSTRSNPLKVPPNAYDNDSSLFLWRTIKFEQGYSVTYTAVIANRREKRPVTLRVRKQERVATPAGEFDAWLVGIEAEGMVQEAWFATTPDHKLLVYDNNDVVFLYEGEAEAEPYEAPRAIDPSPCR